MSEGQKMPDSVPAADMLPWEDLGSRPAADAFKGSLKELIGRPQGFFGRMALSGGLHEPLTFFSIVLGLTVVVAFPAAISYFGLTAPDPGVTDPEVYQLHTLPSRVTGLLVVLLPLVLVAAGAAMVLVGSLFHLPGRLFGADRWEGSVGLWLYSGAAGLLGPLAAGTVVLVVSLAGFLLSLVLPAAEAPAAAVARWSATILLPAGLLAGTVLCVRSLVVGCRRTFELDAASGWSATLSGLLLIAVLGTACLLSFSRMSFTAGTVVSGGLLLAATVLTLVCALRRGRTRVMRGR